MRRVASALALLLCLAAPAAAQPAGRVLVVPFENAQKDPRGRWISEASAVLLADALNALGVAAITRGERVRAFEQLHLPVTATLSRATIIRVGQMVGASEVILGSFTLTGDALAVSAQSVRIDVGRLQPDVDERAPLAEMVRVFDRVAERLTERTLPAGRDALPPLDAFENYIKGLVAESPAVQATFLEAAIRQHAGYDRARLALWEVRTDQGDHKAALDAVQAIGEASRFHRRARFATAVSMIELERHDEAFDATRALAGATPVPAAVYNNLGVIQLRRGATRETGLATYYLTQAVQAGLEEPDLLFNLGYAYVMEKNPGGAIYWLREALRRDPTDPDAHYVLSAALQAAGSTTEAAREKDLALRLSSSHVAELDKRAAADRLPVPKGLERIRTELDAPRALRPEQVIVNSAQREQRDIASFHLEQGRRFYDREEDREAMVELRRAVYLSPYEAQAHLLIGRIHLRGGRSQEAVDALKISVWSADSAAARVALAEAYLKLGDAPLARAEAERALVLDPASAAAKDLLARIAK